MGADRARRGRPKPLTPEPASPDDSAPGDAAPGDAAPDDSAPEDRRAADRATRKAADRAANNHLTQDELSAGAGPRRQPPPDLRPMLATSGSLPSSDSGWAYEMKWDGLRALALITGERIRLTSRTNRDITHVYPELAGLAVASGSRQAVLDGEVVALGADGWPDFEALQRRRTSRR